MSHAMEWTEVGGEGTFAPVVCVRDQNGREPKKDAAAGRCESGLPRHLCFHIPRIRETVQCSGTFSYQSLALNQLIERIDVMHALTCGLQRN